MKELIDKYVGKKATIDCQSPKGMTVNVTITDVKISYGTERYLVSPVEGKGAVWVEKVSLTK